MPLRRFARLALFAILLACAFATGYLGSAFRSYSSLALHTDPAPRRVVVTMGAGPAGIAAALDRAGIRLDASRLDWIIRLRGDAPRYRAAIYDLQPGWSLRQLLDAIAAGSGRQASVRLLEGMTFRQVREAIDGHPDLAADTRALDDPSLLAKLGSSYPNGEGLFHPDTYHFAPGGSALQIYREAFRAMDRLLVSLWASRAQGLPLESPYQALVLASIIEKETGRAEDRPMVASVFVNRLRKGMPLQSDPTTIYALGAGFDGRLRKRDLQLDHPHNTYARGGLPPTPIALPGRAAIEAALQPAQSPALFFVARGDGSTEFSNDLKAHNRAVERFVLKR